MIDCKYFLVYQKHNLLFISKIWRYNQDLKSYKYILIYPKVIYNIYLKLKKLQVFFKSTKIWDITCTWYQKIVSIF